jgi:hypothetical protein
MQQNFLTLLTSTHFKSSPSIHLSNSKDPYSETILLISTHSHLNLTGAFLNNQKMKLVMVFWCFENMRCATKLRLLSYLAMNKRRTIRVL